MTIRPVLIALPLVLLGWLATLVVTALLTDEAPAYVVLFPPDGFLHSLPDDTAMLSTSSISITLASETKSFVPLLYKNGAWVVLPAGLKGCLPLPAVK
ncbi:MAG: hypothetical protein ACPGGK_18420 [Pikeienuella sp.]